MKAIRLHARGGLGEIVYEDAPKPELKPDDALIQVFAAAITPTELTWNETYADCNGAQRLPTIPGHDVSGIVEALGSKVTDLGVGDAVYALTSFCRDGTAAEYVAVRAADLAPKPRSLQHAQAAAVPLSALTAWQALFDHAKLGRGQKVLIHGASGAVGTFAVQLARWTGAHVIGTASAQNAGLLRELGVEQTVDYSTDRFEKKVADVDVVLDTVGGETLERSWSVLRPGGALVSVAGKVSQDQAARRGVRGVFFIVEPNHHQLVKIAELIDNGLVHPLIAEVLPLAQARQAFEHSRPGHKPGKFVLQVNS